MSRSLQGLLQGSTKKVRGSRGFTQGSYWIRDVRATPECGVYIAFGTWWQGILKLLLAGLCHERWGQAGLVEATHTGDRWTAAGGDGGYSARTRVGSSRLSGSSSARGKASRE